LARCGAADGVAGVRASLLKVLKTGKTGAMPLIRYDVKPARGQFEVRWWQITNTPILRGRLGALNP